MNIYCGKCGLYRKHYCRGCCKTCYYRKSPPKKPRQVGAADEEITADELERLIADRLPTMPPDAETKGRGMALPDDAARRVAGVLRVVMVPRRKWR